MKHGYWATPLALLSLLTAVEARGQQHGPRTVQQSALYNSYRSYYAQPEEQASPSDAPVAPTPAPAPMAPPMDVAPLDAPMHAPPHAPFTAGGVHSFIPESCDPPCAHGCYAGPAAVPLCNDGCAVDGDGCGACGCDHGCGCSEDCACGCNGVEEEPWRLFGDIPLFPGRRDRCSEPPTVFIGGWIQGGITGNGDGNRSSQGNYPVPFNQVSDGFIFNQAPWIYAEKAVDTGGAGFDWGARVDYVFGTDGPDTQAFGDEGWDFGWNSSRDYGSAIPQLYVDLGYNNWTLRLGHFFTIIGYEVVPAIGNFFYSHALAQTYAEPFTHTGALLSYTPDDTWTFYNGYTFGWDSGFENNADAHTYLGGVSYNWEDIGTLAWMVNAGKFGDGELLPHGGVAADGDIYMSSLVATLNLTDDIQYVIQHDHGVNYHVPGGPGAEWYGVNQYLFITLTDTIRFGARVEWLDDADGARIGAHPFANPAAVALGPTEGDYFNYTIGLNIAPHTNFMVRPELRWDHFTGTAPAGALPFDNGNEDDLFTAGVDAILQF